MRNHKERVVPHWRQRRRASRRRVPRSVTATCSATSCLPSQRGHGTDSAWDSTTAALITWSGRSGEPPGSSSNRRSRAVCNFPSVRAASRCLVRGRDFLAAIPSAQDSSSCFATVARSTPASRSRRRCSLPAPCTSRSRSCRSWPDRRRTSRDCPGGPVRRDHRRRFGSPASRTRE